MEPRELKLHKRRGPQDNSNDALQVYAHFTKDGSRSDTAYSIHYSLNPGTNAGGQTLLTRLLFEGNTEETIRPACYGITDETLLVVLEDRLACKLPPRDHRPRTLWYRLAYLGIRFALWALQQRGFVASGGFVSKVVATPIPARS